VNVGQYMAYITYPTHTRSAKEPTMIVSPMLAILLVGLDKSFGTFLDLSRSNRYDPIGSISRSIVGKLARLNPERQ
jgi:hypothetical protein